MFKKNELMSRRNKRTLETKVYLFGNKRSLIKKPSEDDLKALNKTNNLQFVFFYRIRVCFSCGDHIKLLTESRLLHNRYNTYVTFVMSIPFREKRKDTVVHVESHVFPLNCRF